MTESSLPPVDENGVPQQTTWLSVLQFFVKDPDTGPFESDMEEMYELARKQPGFIYGQYARSMVDGRYLVISEWESYQALKDWEDEEQHQGVMERNEPRYESGRDMQNRKFIPWYKPGAERKPWTK
jgi:heme-degrading monooxygenase HmoA